MNYLKNRLKEPSTWASLAALGALLAPKYAEQINQAVPALVTLAGLLGAALPESAQR